MQDCKGNHTVQMLLPSDGLLHFEDLLPGMSLTSGAKTVSRDDIIAFALDFDPQPIHLDDAAAKASIVGGLCASGFHTCAIMMRLLCDEFLLRSTSLGSPGLDEVKWLKPVRPGDTLAVRIAVLESRVLQSRPDVGLCKMRFELLSQGGDVVLEAMTNQLMRRRLPDKSPPIAKTAKAAKPVEPTLWDEPASTTQPRGNYFEDIVTGDVRDIGAHTFEADEIITFAREFDPQPFHLSERGGKNSLFGGLAASGWHTAATFIRHVVLARQANEAYLRGQGQSLAQWGPSPGFRLLAWPRPVLKGDRIEYRNKVIETRELKSRPTRGIVISQGEGRNQRGETVFRMIGQLFVERRV
jgi:acyl dehydratase